MITKIPFVKERVIPFNFSMQFYFFCTLLFLLPPANFAHLSFTQWASVCESFIRG